MPGSTSTSSTHRVSLQAPPARVRFRPRRILATRAGSGELSSHAGLHGRPWLARLRRALEQDLFVLHFQPIASLADGGVHHYEALLRLADEPAGGLVAPGRFLPAAERSGIVREIDRMVLRKAISQLAALACRPGRELAIAVNLSALSVTDTRTLATLQRELALQGVAPQRLVVEVTETVAISDMRSAREFCAGVQRLGCAIALDDFGAGFGSFQYLKHLPFSYLKIDGGFIRALTVSRTDQLVVRALAELVRGMGARTIAEFVADEDTLAMLRGYGVDYAQGFAVGRPSPAIGPRAAAASAALAPPAVGARDRAWDARSR